MPEFTPTLKMLELHADKGDEEWEIYAECIREAMSKASGKPMLDQPLREKIAYEDFMCGDKKQMKVGGKIFSFDKNENGVIEDDPDQEKHELESKSSRGSKKTRTSTKNNSRDSDQIKQDIQDEEEAARDESCDLEENSQAREKPHGDDEANDEA